MTACSFFLSLHVYHYIHYFLIILYIFHNVKYVHSQMHPTLKKLVDMGFEVEVAQKALLQANGDENAAVEILLSSM